MAFYYPDAVSYAASYGRQWDPIGLNPWYRYQAAGTWYQGWYDDPESMAHKYDLVLDRNLMGVGMWALGMDGANHDIWDVLDSYFGDSSVVARPPSPPVLSVVRDSSDAGRGTHLGHMDGRQRCSAGGLSTLSLYRSGDASSGRH